uniref:SEC7 domain-containing protein n=1 Tax=Panagrellus redivivus TaxID=6233 RepID=A0A7E4WE95_PANRE
MSNVHRIQVEKKPHLSPSSSTFGSHPKRPPPVDMFLKTSLEGILNDKDIKRKENAQLKKACEGAIEQLNAEIELHQRQTSSTTQPLPNSNDYIVADGYFYPFELACQSKSPRIVATAIDVIGKLISYGHLIGDSPDASNPDTLLIDRIVESVCYPFQGPHTDDEVQLRIIRTVLIVVLSNTAKVHDHALLRAVRTCFDIYLASKNKVNTSTAKGILTQTISHIFNAMEKQEQMDQNVELDLDEMVVKSVLDNLINQVVQSTSNSTKDSTPVSVSVPQIAENERSSASSMVNGGIHSPAPPPVSHLSVEGLAEHLPSPSAVDEAGAKLDFQSPEEKDAYLIFRSLCKLSAKALPSEGIDKNSTEMRSKLLSLDMILLVVQNFNAPLSDQHSFVVAIRLYLCVALTQNAVSPYIPVFEKSLAIFVQLVNKFRVHLKRQIEVFFKEIIISILESSSSIFEQKWIVMHAISKIFDDATSVVDIYINYDCHLTSANIFESLVNILSKISSGYVGESSPNATVLQREREKKMRELGLECFVKVLQSLVTFYDEVNETKGKDNSIRGDDTDEAMTNGSNYEHLKQQKGKIESGIELFAKKPKQGLALLQEHGFVGTEPEDIARFYHVEERLDKTVLGDYLGDGDDFHKKVMYAYIDQFDFADVPFLQALRNFLDKFRLPGEAQKIDRLMEKFASRYCECNPTQNIFASADTAYVLSYAVIMLTTDLHSPQVRKKMTKEEFIRSVRGINDQNDLPEDFVSGIYDDIAVNEIKMKAGATGKPKLNADIASVSYRQLKQFQNLELESISQTAHALMEAASLAHVEFTTVNHYEHVRPIFLRAWTPCLAAFSIGLQSSDDEDIWRWCLEGFRHGIRVACVFRMVTQRDAYVQALTRFTLLMAKNALSEMKAKNVESIKLLITIGVEDGDFLEDCWYDVLKCISQLELAQLIGTSGPGMQKVFNIDDKTMHTIQECLSETNNQSVVVAVDRIFQGSSRLSGEAIVHFVRALARVSLEELALSGAPRMFMLQKIVEISFYNMGRIRIEWSMIWNILGEHFNAAGCSDNSDVSHFALDALRQLSTKFLEKGELPNFRLQKEFLRPFEVIMDNNISHDCREMVIACVTHMVQAHAGRIRSGWKNIFIVFAVAANESRQDLLESAFATTSDIISKIFPNHFSEVIDSFPEAVKCLSEFACNNTNDDTSMEAIRLIRSCAELVRRYTDLFDTDTDLTSPGSGPPSTYTSPTHSITVTSADNHRVWAKGWLSIFIQLWSIISRSKLDVRTRSLTVLFEIIKTYGRDFRPAWWTDVFKIVFKIFKFSSLGPNKTEWMVTTCNHALFSIVDVISEHFKQLAPHVPTFYEQLFLCIQQGSEQLARAAIDVLENLVVSNGKQFDPEMWDCTVELIIRIFKCSIITFEDEEPNGVENGQTSPEKSPADGTPRGKALDTDCVLTSPITRIIIQLEVVDAVTGVLFGKDAFKVEGPVSRRSPDEESDSVGNNDWAERAPQMYEYLTQDHLSRLITCLLESHTMARTFNSNSKQREMLWKAALRGKTPPNVIKLEWHTIHTALNILFHLYADTRIPEKHFDELKKWLIHSVNVALTEYVSIRSEQQRSAWLSVIQMMLNRTYELSDDRFAALGTPFFVNLAELVETEEPQIIRAALKRVVARALTSPPPHHRI